MVFPPSIASALSVPKRVLPPPACKKPRRHHPSSSSSVISCPGRRIPSSRNRSCKLCRCRPIVAAVREIFQRCAAKLPLQVSHLKFALGLAKVLSLMPRSAPSSPLFGNTGVPLHHFLAAGRSRRSLLRGTRTRRAPWHFSVREYCPANRSAPESSALPSSSAP